MPPVKKSEKNVIRPSEIRENAVTLHIIGITPFIYNAMSLKVRQELLLPKGRKTAADRATTLKHNPMQEYRDSVYRRREQDEGPTTLTIPARMFKAAISEVARRVPGGGTTTEIKQLVTVLGENLDFYGIPQMHMGVVRNSDINRTPDIRTRAIIPQWACKVTVSYVSPNLTADAIVTLVHAAGKLNGVGDYRQQKGDGNYGQFVITNDDDANYKYIVDSMTREVQDQALQEPLMYDHETEELYDWYMSEIQKRNDDPVAANKNAKKTTKKAA